MSFFKKVINGLFNDSKEKKEEHSNEEYSPALIKEAPLTYWEEFSYMLALAPENYKITEDIFTNIEALDGIEIKEKIMSSEDLPGKLVISYDGVEYEVGFYIGDFYTEEMYQWQLQYFTEEEKEQILKIEKYALYHNIKLLLIEPNLYDNIENEITLQINKNFEDEII